MRYQTPKIEPNPKACLPNQGVIRSLLLPHGIRRGGRVVDRVGLENRRASGSRGFESHPLRPAPTPACPERSAGNAHAKRFAIDHWQSMDTRRGELRFALIMWRQCKALRNQSLAIHEHKEGRTPIRPDHVESMQSASSSIIGDP
jgi:hypothetical protein